jgi:hypothetical protein
MVLIDEIQLGSKYRFVFGRAYRKTGTDVSLSSPITVPFPSQAEVEPTRRY